MDDDSALQALGAELERDDPALAALLSGPVTPHHRHRGAWTLLVVTVLTVGLIAAPAVTLGIAAMLVVLASPLLACWWCAFPGDEPAAGHP